jgi:DNA modification methylase
MIKVNISQVKPNPKNPRVIRDGKFQKLVQSIKEFPDMLNKRPLIVFTDVDGKYCVLGGNMRLKALNELKYTEIPVIIADEWNEEQKSEFLIKDNVGFGEWDWDQLANEWDAEKLNDWGLDLPIDLHVEELEAEEDGYEIPETIETDIVLGDLFEIGEHRLLCGDSTDSDSVAKLMDGQKADILFTSPPYSDMREYNGNKDLSVSNIIEFITTFYQYCDYQIINLGIQRKENEIIEYWNDYIEKAKENNYKFLSWNVWNREEPRSIAQQTAFIPIAHEWIFVFGKKHKEINKTIECKMGGKKTKSINRNADGSQFKREYEVEALKKINSVTTTGVESSGIHPAMFPVDLPAEYIKALTNENNIIVEPFTGSGTTMVAAHQLKRKCYGMELDPKYCQVIIDRMKKLDPSLEIKRNGKLIK